MKKETHLFIGTSGWTYGDWVKIFYPENLKSSEFLQYYAKHFNTVEVNYSFYHLPKPKTYEKWSNQTPKDFIFAIKASRFITHIKRLKGIGESWKNFLENAKSLKDKLGPILLQMPPSFKIDLERVEQFLKLVRKTYLGPLAFEFRHKSWFLSRKVPSILGKYKAALVFSHSFHFPYPKKEPITADFVYLRFHGPKELFASLYGSEFLKPFAQKIQKWLSQGLEVYVYFNNDVSGYAILDAQTLRTLL